MELSGESIAYVMKVLRKNAKYSRTYAQKIIYLVTHDDTFESYQNGMYSPDVQRILQYLEHNYNKIDEWSENVDKNFKRKVDILIDYIKQNKLSTYEIADISKLDYLINVLNVEPNLTNNEFVIKCDVLGWRNLRYNENLDKLLEHLHNINRLLKD